MIGDIDGGSVDDGEMPTSIRCSTSLSVQSDLDQLNQSRPERNLCTNPGNLIVIKSGWMRNMVWKFA